MGSTSIARAQQFCNIDTAQWLFSQSPRPDERVFGWNRTTDASCPRARPGAPGYSPTINKPGLHGRSVHAMTDRIARQFAAGPGSIDVDTPATSGLHFT
jgi:hypothetical protein